MSPIFFLVFLAGAIYCQEEENLPSPGENCVDLSKYGDVEYNETTVELCTYSLSKTCTKKTTQACINVMETSCEIETSIQCTNTPTVQTLNDDTTVSLTYTEKVCTNGTATLTETKMMPVCENVTAEQCDSKWVIDSTGEKVWAGDENCQNVTWMDCRLDMIDVSQEVEVWDCQDGAIIDYVAPNIKSVEVTTYEQKCEPVAYPVCTQNIVNKCEDVECEECSDSVETKCFPACFSEPSQTFDHRMRCTVQH